MKVIYALFERYADARDAVNELLDQGYDQDEMNAIVQAHIAQEHIDLDLGSVGVQVTDAVGNKTVRGFDPFLAAQAPVPVPGLGDMYAAGELATTLAKTAAIHGGRVKGLQSALDDFVPSDVARDFADSVGSGSLLFWIRTDDERAGHVAQTLGRHHGKRVRDYVG
jgi:hypothetical protein